MISRSTKQGKNRSVAVGLTIGTAVCCIITILLTSLIAYLISRERISENNIRLFTSLIHYLSVLIGTYCVNTLIKRKLLPVSLLQCTCYLAVLFASTALFWGGQYGGIGSTLIAVILGGASGILAILCVNKIQKNTFKKSAYR